MDRRFAASVIVVGAAFLIGSCGGNSTLDDTEAPVVLTVEIEEYGPDIPICLQSFDLTIETMNIASSMKDPGASPSSNQDAIITRWVVTPVRTDGGTEASPQWSHDFSVLVPAGGEATLENYRVYPAENFEVPPLSYLLPENGGFDPETGNRNIRQSLRLQIYGETIAGKAVATQPVLIPFNFFCGN